jgi:hypothetical protein
MNVSLGERDLCLLKIQNEIENKKQLLIKKKKDLDNKCKTNKYLREVKKDYAKYYDHIINEKQQQQNAFTQIKKYIDDLIETEQLINYQSIVAKYDQKQILNEIDKIQNELNKITDNTK